MLYAYLEDHPPEPGSTPAVPPVLLDIASASEAEAFVIGIYLPERLRERPILSGVEAFVDYVTQDPAWSNHLIYGNTWEQLRSQVRVYYELQLEWELYVVNEESWTPLRTNPVPSGRLPGKAVIRLVTRRLDPDFEIAFDPLQLVHAAYLGDWYAIGSLIRDGHQIPICATIVHGSNEIVWKIRISDEVSPYEAFDNTFGVDYEWSAVFQKEAFQREVRRALDEGLLLSRLYQIEDHPELQGGRLAVERLAYQMGEEGGLKHPVNSWVGRCRKDWQWSERLRAEVCRMEE